MKIIGLKLRFLVIDPDYINVLNLTCYYQVGKKFRYVTRSLLYVKWRKWLLPAYWHFQILWLPVGHYVYKLLRRVKKGSVPNRPQ